MTIYSLDVLLFLFGTSLLFHVQFTIHTVKGFGIVNKAEIDVFLELSCFFDDPADVGNLISGSSAFSKPSLDIWKFLVHLEVEPSSSGSWTSGSSAA